MKIREALALAAGRLNESRVDDPLREARLLLSLQPLFTLSFQLAHPDQELTDAEWRLFEAHTERRSAGEPFQYVAGTAAFLGRAFAVGPGVLIPRPETEQLTEWWIEAAHRRFSGPLCIVDLCTGSGCIGLTAALELERLGTPVESLYLSDISGEALAYARQNQEALAPALSVRFVPADLFFDPWPAADLIFCNPPYIDVRNDPALSPGVSRYEPATALDGGPDGLHFYRRLAAGLGRRAASHALIGVEHGYRQGEAVRQIFSDAGFDAEASMTDYSGHERGQRFTLRRSKTGNR